MAPVLSAPFRVGRSEGNQLRRGTRPPASGYWGRRIPAPVFRGTPKLCSTATSKPRSLSATAETSPGTASRTSRPPPATTQASSRSSQRRREDLIPRSRRYFRVASASELLFEATIACPAHLGLTFDGFAVAHASTCDQVFVVSIHDVALRAYLGPDHDTAQRRGSPVVAGLMSNPDIRLEACEAVDVLSWLTDCWDIARECVDNATAAVDGTDRCASRPGLRAGDRRPVHARDICGRAERWTHPTHPG